MSNILNPNNVFSYGISNGCAMAMKMIKDTSLFKAITVLAMTLVEGERLHTTVSKVPILFIHGKEYATVFYEGCTESI